MRKLLPIAPESSSWLPRDPDDKDMGNFNHDVVAGQDWEAHEFGSDRTRHSEFSLGSGRTQTQFLLVGLFLHEILYLQVFRQIQ